MMTQLLQKPPQNTRHDPQTLQQKHLDVPGSAGKWLGPMGYNPKEYLIYR